MENQNKKNNAGTIALVVLLLIVTIAALVLATYAWAKYTAKSDNNTATANVAKWNVTLDTTNKNFAGEYSHVLKGKIAPGTKGDFDITINPNDTEVCIAYQIKLTGAKYTLNGTVTNGMIKHLKFFSDAEHTKEIKVDGTVNNDLTGTIDLTGTTHNTAGAATVTEKVYWIWPYDYAEASALTAYASDIEDDAEAYDAADTATGEGVTDVTVTYEIRAWQVDPANSEATDNTTTTNLPN